jgi:hypothetical protein
MIFGNGVVWIRNLTSLHTRSLFYTRNKLINSIIISYHWYLKVSIHASDELRRRCVGRQRAAVA